MAVYVEPPRRGKWFGKKRAAPKPTDGGQTEWYLLLKRLDGSITRIEAHDELDDEMRHTLISQALTYEEFVSDVHDGARDARDERVILAMASVKDFCTLIETEL